MVSGMGTMNAPPVCGVEGAQDGMVEYLGHAAESLFRIRQSGVHGDQGVIEVTATTARRRSEELSVSEPQDL